MLTLVLVLLALIGALVAFVRYLKAPYGQPYNGGKCVVLGGGIGGLGHAAAASLHFREVVVLEQDADEALDRVDQGRSGVPQSTQSHAMQAGGSAALEVILPGLDRYLLSQGAEYMQYGRDSDWIMYGTRSSSKPQPFHMTCSTRPFLEHHLRTFLLRSRPNIRFVSGARVTKLEASDGRVTAVCYKHEGETKREEELELVIDATGRRGGAVKRWIALGSDEPKVTEVVVNVNYSTTIVRFDDPNDAPPKKFTLVGAIPPDNKRFGLLIKSENETYTFLCAGWNNFPVPRDFPGLVEYVRELHHPAVYERVKGASVVREPRPYLFKSDYRVHYADVANKPKNYIPVADTIASVNPTFGQAMTIAMKGALALHLKLNEATERYGHLDRLCDDYLRYHDIAVEGAWTLVSAVDLSFPETTGVRDGKSNFVYAYAKNLLIAQHIAAVATSFLPTLTMINANNPVAVFHPLNIAGALGAKLGIIKPSAE